MQFRYEIDTQFTATITPKWLYLGVIGDAGTQNGVEMINVAWRIETPYGGTAQVDDVMLIQGTVILPRTVLAPLALNDKTQLNALLSNFEFGGMLAGLTLKIK